MLDREIMEYEAGLAINSKQFIVSDVIQGFMIPVRAIFDQKVNLDTLQSLMN